MSPVNSWTFYLLLCISSMVYSKKCVWLQDNYKELPNKLLNDFQKMISEEETSDDCETKIQLPDTSAIYNTSQVESAAMTVRDLFYLTAQFYTKHQEKLVTEQTAWEQLKNELYHQTNLLDGCISRSTKKRNSVQKISKYFSELGMILEEQKDAACARRIIHDKVNENLLRAAGLSTRIRTIHSRRTPE